MSDPPAPRQLLLVFGMIIAVANFIGWAAADYATYGTLTERSLRMALFAASAVLALYLVLRLALFVTGEESA